LSNQNITVRVWVYVCARFLVLLFLLFKYIYSFIFLLYCPSFHAFITFRDCIHLCSFSLLSFSLFSVLLLVIATALLVEGGASLFILSISLCALFGGCPFYTLRPYFVSRLMRRTTDRKTNVHHCYRYLERVSSLSVRCTTASYTGTAVPANAIIRDVSWTLITPATHDYVPSQTQLEYNFGFVCSNFRRSLFLSAFCAGKR
jgi:hypothetical protein